MNYHPGRIIAVGDMGIITVRNGKETKITKVVQEKQVVFWGRKYADKAKAERKAMLNKALRFIKEPAGYKRHTGHGSAKYINGIDKETGEVNPETLLPINREPAAEEARYVGCYAIVTCELRPADEAIETYRGLWEIEESFRITKGGLGARPIYVSRHDRIDAHLLACFIALIILRILQKKTEGVYSAKAIIDALNRLSGSLIQGNRYLFDEQRYLSTLCAMRPHLCNAAPVMPHK
jgi:transposase